MNNIHFGFQNNRNFSAMYWNLYFNIVMNVKIFGKNASNSIHFLNVLKLNKKLGKKFVYLVTGLRLGNFIFRFEHFFRIKIHSIAILKQIYWTYTATNFRIYQIKQSSHSTTTIISKVILGFFVLFLRKMINPLIYLTLIDRIA